MAASEIYEYGILFMVTRLNSTLDGIELSSNWRKGTGKCCADILKEVTEARRTGKCLRG
ncbi:MAG: hypothetical protein M1454_05955 [Candidatus Thermoplasmatota archaeon]|nr:hypothetical protein [Candidatus Thermoplasmatota archaeon]MCL5731170.1 hypothetical protein [Candidatus Thermoplasmatota archaeon]